MGYFEDLTKAFDIALKSFGSANSLPVALENIDAPTSTATPYLASFMLLADTDQADLGFTERRGGIFQIDINYASARGQNGINKTADLLNATFKAGATFRRNGICAEVQSVSLGPLIVQNGWAKRPLSIDFIAFTERL
jgi:hypothetical protein